MDEIRIVRDERWADGDKASLDPGLRVALSLIELGDPSLIFQRTGIGLQGVPREVPPAQGAEDGSGRESGTLFLPLHIEVNERPTGPLLDELQSLLNLSIPRAYLAEAERNASVRSLTAQLKLLVRGPVIEWEALRQSLVKIVDHPAIRRVSLAMPLAPCDTRLGGETLRDFGMPPQRKVTIHGNEYIADGSGTVIGIIDDGCSYAHWNFLRDGPASRMLYIWDQGRTSSAKDWKALPDFPYGRELTNLSATGDPPIDAALRKFTDASGVIDEDAVYDEIDLRPYDTIDFRPFNAATHGTHVMDIAAGNGRSLFGREGVAPAADLIFVQLPRELVRMGGPALTRCIQDGAQYIFNRTKSLETARGKPVPTVVNISFGNYLGPHDGSLLVEAAFETMLAVPDRAIVIAAGNGFAARCHAQGTVVARRPVSLHWLVEPFDESMNSMEIWYTGASDVEFYLTPPGATARLGPVTAGAPRYNIIDANGERIGYIDHVGALPGNGDNLITIALHPTWDGNIPLAPVVATNAAKAARCPSGTWLIELEKRMPTKSAPFHAWIERDETFRGDPVRRRQSCFADDEASPRCTVTGFATGVHTIAVGGYHTATGEMAEYSACGPTRPSSAHPRRRRKPEICAPAAFDARGRGVRSASTRFSLDSRMGGTSASAPHVAGLAALVLQLNRDVNQANKRVAPLPIAVLRRLLSEGAVAAARPLHPNRHQADDSHQPIKQRLRSIWKYLVGHGAAHAGETVRRIK
jgi:subtilisin family serine protease